MNYQEAYNTSISLGHCPVFANTYAVCLSRGADEFMARDAGYKKLRETLGVIEIDEDILGKLETMDEVELQVYNEALHESRALGKSELFSRKYAQYVQLQTFVIPMPPGYCFAKLKAGKPFTKVAEEFARKYVMTYIQHILTEGQPDRYYPAFEQPKNITRIGKENQSRLECDILHKFNRSFTLN